MRAIAGTHTVLLAMDLHDPTGCLGFAIKRTEILPQGQGESVWLKGMKTFGSVESTPPPGSQWPTNAHPIQGFQWGDYGAVPGRTYVYAVSPVTGTPAVPTLAGTVEVKVTTEVEDDGVHGVWFNRGVAGSQAFARRFAGWVPTKVPDEDHPAMRWLSRGLREAFEAFCAQATGPEWGLLGAFYEFTWSTGLLALKAAADRGADVRLVIHGRDSDAAGKDEDTTAASARAQVSALGLDPLVTWRVAPNKGALQHNKFLVLTKKGRPVAVWTGSTNLTLGAVYGHSNVAHVVRDRAAAVAFTAYWERLASPATTAALRVSDESANPVSTTVPPGAGISVITSPRASRAVLDWYADVFDSGVSSTHITGAFGLNTVFRDRLAVNRAPVTRTVLLDKTPARAQDRIPLADSHVRLSTGAHLREGALSQWAAERLTGFNGHVRYVHTKIILVDPLGDDPVVVTGSANYSDASTTSNEENTLVIRRGTTRATSRRAVERVADIYLTEYHRIFMHFPFRAWAQSREVNTGAPQPVSHLEETDHWSQRYFVPGSWRESQRRLFAGT